MISLKSPKITAAERKSLTIHQERLTAAINDVDAEVARVVELRKKERKFQKESDSLRHHAAAHFDRDSEIKHAGTLKQIERVADAIHEAESRVHDKKNPLFRALDDAQEQVGKLCQVSYEQLLDLQAAALAPFWQNLHEARQVGRTSPAVRHLVHTLLSHHVNEFDSIERLDETARDVLRKVAAILSGSEIFQFEGAPMAESSAAA